MVFCFPNSKWSVQAEKLVLTGFRDIEELKKLLAKMSTPKKLSNLGQFFCKKSKKIAAFALKKLLAKWNWNQKIKLKYCPIEWQSAVWPDWAIFESSWLQILLQKYPQILDNYLGRQ